MTNYGQEARKKFVDRAEARRAEDTGGPRSFKQFALERSGLVFEPLDPDQRILERFGIEKNAPRKTISGYEAAASEEPMINILDKSPMRLDVLALELLERKGIDEDEIPTMIARAQGNAKSPKQFWNLLDKYWIASREKPLRIPNPYKRGFMKRVAAMKGSPTKKLERKG